MLKFPLDKKQIEDIYEDDIDALVNLDKQGLLLGFKEDISSYKERLLNIESEIQNLAKELETRGKVELFNNIYATETELIPNNIFKHVDELTKSKYGFSVNWVPGFFLSKGLGLLTGGCSAISGTGFTFFLIRSNFALRKKWLWYDRNELLSHELCHAARGPIKDTHFEEFFAYKISPSPLRRYLGNCFQKQFDAILLLIPIFLLLVIQIINSFFLFNIPIFIFWIIAFLYPILLLIRNQHYRNWYFKAKKSLTTTYGKKIPFDSILFRCNSKEIIQIGKFKDSPDRLKEWIKNKSKNELRWKVITKRFIP